MDTPRRAGASGGSGGVATSKFAVPRRRPDVVRRPRLNAFIDAAVGGKGTLIAAPAGYGKTTLVVDWLQTSDFAAVWLALDSWDDDIGAFARALAEAIGQRLDLDVALGDERFWQPRVIATVLINAIASQDEYVVLVLDDVHAVEASAPVMTTIGYLLERAPENLHVVMTSRTRPPVPSLARLMARREVASVGAADLAFTPREVRELLGSLGRAVSEDEAETLYERTEGWAAALILGAGTVDAKPRRIEVEGEAAAGGAGSIAGPNVGLSLADYVHGEALDNVPAELRAFLRQIALLPVWTPALCNDVTDGRDSERLLKEAATRVLFVTQHADEPPMYRCHQLMRSLLMQQYRAEDPDGFADAGRSAADALSRFGMLNEAVELLFELKEWSDAATVLDQIAPRLLQQGQARGLAEWIDRLPAEAQSSRPSLVVWRARASLKTQEFDEALRLVEEALRALRAAGDIPGLVQALMVRGETMRWKGYYDDALATFAEARAMLDDDAAGDDAQLTGDVLRNIGVTHVINGNLDAGIEELEEARRLLEQVGDLQGIGNTCGTLAQAYSTRGESLQALGALQRAQSAFERAGNTYDLGLTLNNTGMVYYELGEYEQALQVYDRGVRLVRGTGDLTDEAFMMAGIAETYRSMGRFEESLATYDETRPLAETLQIPYLTAEIAEGLALTKLGMGQGEDAAQLARSVAPKPSDSPARIAQHALVEAQIALERGDASAALKALDGAWKLMEAADNRRQMAVTAFLRARALFDAHQPRKAMSEVQRVAQICDALGYRRFLRPYAVRAKEMVEYALVRHVADGLFADLAADGAIAHASGERRGRTVALDMLPLVRAFAFGRGSVLVGERQVSDLEWRSEKSKEMFFLLLLSTQESLGKEEIFTALWPDLPESKCNSNFHSSLYRLRRALFHECVVRDADGGYMLNPKGVFASDVTDFNRTMLEADVAKDDGARAEKLQSAIALYTGGFLASTYSEWTESLRRELEDRYIEALNELAARQLREGKHEDALALFKLLQGVDAYSEAASYGIMKAYVSLNDGASAMRHYRRFRQVLKDELDEEPSERLAALYREASGRA